MTLFKDMLSSDESLFLNPQFLDLDYQPKLVPYRESQQQYIATCIKPLLQKRSGKNLLILGKCGVGKTVCLRHVLKELNEDYGDDIFCLYVNCWKKDTPFKIIVELAQQLGYSWIHNKSYDELIKVVIGLINEKSAVLVLDEIDKLQDQTILYAFAEDLYKKELILITNDNEFLITIDSRISSRLSLDKLEFKPYNLAETEGILKYRLGYAFPPNSFSKDAFNELVKKTFEVGDIRVGLYLMKESAELAELKSSRTINLEHAHQAIKKLIDFKTKNIDALPDDEQDILKLIKENSGKTTMEIFKIYEKMPDAKSYKTFSRRVKDLEKANMIKLTELNMGSEGRMTKIDYIINKKLGDFEN